MKTKEELMCLIFNDELSNYSLIICEGDEKITINYLYYTPFKKDKSEEINMVDYTITSIYELSEHSYIKDLLFGSTGSIDGWVANLDTTSITLDTYAGVSVTRNNIDNIIDDFINKISDIMWCRDKLTLHCSWSIFNMYKMNRILDASIGVLSTRYKNELYINNYEGLISIKAEPVFMNENLMFLTWDKNLNLGVDISSVKILSDEYCFKLNTQIAFKDEVITNK